MKNQVGGIFQYNGFLRFCIEIQNRWRVVRYQPTCLRKAIVVWPQYFYWCLSPLLFSSVSVCIPSFPSFHFVSYIDFLLILSRPIFYLIFILLITCFCSHLPTPIDILYSNVFCPPSFIPYLLLHSTHRPHSIDLNLWVGEFAPGDLGAFELGMSCLDPWPSSPCVGGEQTSIWCWFSWTVLMASPPVEWPRHHPALTMGLFIYR